MRGCRRCSDLRDGLDQVLIERDKVGAVLVVDDDIGEIDEEALFLIDGIRHPVAHGRNEKVSNIDAVDRPDTNANLLAFWHRLLLPACRTDLAFSAQEFLTPAQFLILVLAHLLSALFQYASHSSLSPTQRSLRSLVGNCKQCRGDGVIDVISTEQGCGSLTSLLTHFYTPHRDKGFHQSWIGSRSARVVRDHRLFRLRFQGSAVSRRS